MLFSPCDLLSKLLLSEVFAGPFVSPESWIFCPIRVELAIGTSSVDRFHVPLSICFVFLLFSLEIALEFDVYDRLFYFRFRMRISLRDYCADFVFDSFRVNATSGQLDHATRYCVTCDLSVSRDQATRLAPLGRVHINSARATCFGWLCLQLSSVGVIHSTFRAIEIT